MTNVEKVIKGLRCLTGMPRCDTCPYSNNPQRQYCLNQIGKDAIKLLKEQEVIPTRNVQDRAVCKCGLVLCELYNYCPECGKRINWDED